MRAARDNLHAVSEHQRILAVRMGLGALDMVDVHDYRAIDAHEALRTELPPGTIHGVPHEVSFAQCV